MTQRTRTLLIVILVISVLLRVGMALYLGSTVEELPGTADQISYHNLALRVLQGYGFTFGEYWWPGTAANSPTAHWSYLYTAYLVVVYALFGPNALAARLIQAVLVGLLHPYLAYRVGRYCFNETVGLVSAAVTAVYAYFIYYAANLMTEGYYITAILASLYLAMKLAGRRAEGDQPVDREALTRDLKLAIGLGLSLGAAVLLRQLFLLFLPFLFLWVLWVGRRRKFLPLAVSGILVLSLILPFTIFNDLRFNRFVLLNTNAGFAFFWGNHPIYGTHFQPILPSETYFELIPEELRSLDEAALDQALLKRGVQFVLEDPLRYLQLSLSRIPAYFMFWSSGESSLVSNISRLASFGLLWPFMLWGLILSFRRVAGITPLKAAPVILLYLFILIYTAIHLLTWALIRYRLPVDAVLVMFASLAIIDLLGRVPSLRHLREKGLTLLSSE